MPSIFDEVEFRGKWWLPHQPNVAVRGTLRFSPDNGVVLHLDGTFDPEGSTPSLANPAVKLEPSEYGRVFGGPLILGQRTSGPKCVIFGAMFQSRGMGMSGAMESKYSGTAFMEGGHVRSADEPFFKAINFRLTYFERWLGGQPVSAKPVFENDKMVGHTLVYRYPEELTFELDKHRLKLTTYPLLHEDSHASPMSVTWVPDVALRLEHAGNWTLDRSYETVTEFRRLMTLLLDYPVYVTEFAVEGDPVALDDETSVPAELKLFVPQPHRRIRENFFEHQMLMTFESLKGKLGDMFSAWLDRAESLKSVFELMESVFFESRMLPHVGFLLLTQAFETFHRTEVGGTYMDSEAYETVRAALSQAIPEKVEASHREALKTRIRFGNSFSMRKRLDTSFRSLEAGTQAYFSERPAKFGARIADTRNYLTHRDETSKGDNVIDNADLAVAADKFRYFFTLLLLRRLGLPEQDIVNGLDSNSTRNMIIRWKGL